MLKSRLQNIATKYDLTGLDTLLELSPEDHLDLETLINQEINTAFDKKLQHYIKLRFLFRILLKYNRDIQQGLNQLAIYENDE